jgi:translation initiation factor IF-1
LREARENGKEMSSDKKKRRQLAAKVLEVLPRSLFKVKTEDGREVLCHVTLTVRNTIGRVLENDSVIVELSEYDPKRGRITEHRPSSPR